MIYLLYLIIHIRYKTDLDGNGLITLKESGLLMVLIL